MDMLLISGKQGSGKTTISALLKNSHRNMGFDAALVLKFADPIYEMHDAVLSRMAYFTGTKKIKKDGKLLQYLGTEFGRENYGADVWVNILKDRVKIWEPKNILLIVDDCRFENEFDAFPKALRVRLVAGEGIRQFRTDAWRPNTTHASEVGLDKYEAKKKFDLYVDTGLDQTPLASASIIGDYLRDKNRTAARFQRGL